MLGKVYVSTAEAKRYPFIGVQWHPEKASFEFAANGVNHDIEAVLLAQGVANQFVQWARQSSHSFTSDDSVILFDVQQRQILGELSCPQIKYVVWNSDMTRVALLSKHAIVISDRKLVHSVTVHETIRVKSAAWDDSGVLLYTTLNHMKYCLPNGDHSIIRTLETPVYITRVFGNAVFCLDREGKNKTMQIDTTEYMFKLALLQRKYDQVLHMIKHSNLCGQAVIAYLQQKGYPEVALHFVKDELTRFNLAIECGNIEVAVQAAQELDDNDIWYRLGVEALRQGNQQIVEATYQKTKNFERLSFLYLITGNLEKLQKMLKIADARNDVMGSFHNSIYLGDVRHRVKILEDAGQTHLAYVTAKTHGLEDVAEKLSEKLDGQVPEVHSNGDQKLMMPQPPILRADNWPLLTVSKGMFEGAFAQQKMEGKMAAQDLNLDDVQAAGWGEDELELNVAGGEGYVVVSGVEEYVDVEEAALEDGGDEDGGWEMEDLDLPPDVLKAAHVGEVAVFAAPTQGRSYQQLWLANCQLAAEHVAAGAFDSAMRMLNRQIGVVNFEPLQSYFMDVYVAAQASLQGLPNMPSYAAHLDRSWSGDDATAVPKTPAVVYSLQSVEISLKRAYKLVTEGKFSNALEMFNSMLLMIPMIVVQSRKEVDEVKEVISICKEYHIGLRCELTKKEVQNDQKKVAELAAYFTHCNLQPVHLMLSLRAAMTVFFKLKNYATCQSFCRRLLELNPGEKFSQQARQVLAACEKAPNDAVELDYDPRNPFDICSITFTPIYRGSKYVEDPFTGARFQPSCEGQLSPLGNIVKIGADASGLRCSAAQR
eukprot:TRINITY_DN6173_c0_g1_i3.p1 TRINITY_DN6173_c0_g1~~TRINITY_DN6173_c0_g1_i3.p1  ORF type:complete len:868 (+),score=125.06 TRINITY_DN6173_c0_g1_i3:140-2605(+)